MAESVQNLFAFVLMPFDKKFDDLYKLGIKDVAAKVGVIAERVDEQKFTESMLDRIYRQIDAADVIIAEMTGQNPNVFYEVGYAHAKDKLVILITADASDIPFDLKHRRHIIHGNSILKLRESLLPELTWARRELEQRRGSALKFELSYHTPCYTALANPNRDEIRIGLKLTLLTIAELPVLRLIVSFWKQRSIGSLSMTGARLTGLIWRTSRRASVTDIISSISRLGSCWQERALRWIVWRREVISKCIPTEFVAL
jgi:hypothetical protein